MWKIVYREKRNKTRQELLGEGRSLLLELHARIRWRNVFVKGLRDLWVVKT